MTQGRDGFSLAHRAALRIANAGRALAIAMSAAVIASLALAGVTHAGPPDPLAVTVSNFPLQGSINLYGADPVHGKNQRPTNVISGGEVVPGLSSTALLSGITASPTNGALYVTQDLSILVPGLDFVEIFAPNATGASGPIGVIATNSSMPAIPLSLPQSIAFINVAGASLGQFYVSNFTAGSSAASAVGNVILFPADAGTATNPLPTPVGIIPNALECPTSAIILPVGVATDSLGNVYVASQGVPGLAPSQVSEYAVGATGCIAPIGVFGAGTLAQAEFVAVDPEGDVWVSDLAQNAIFEFAPGVSAPVTSIQGKRTKLKSPMGIALSPAGLAAGSDDLYVANNRLGEIDLFEDVGDAGLLNAHGKKVLKGKRTKMNLPVGIAPLD